MGAWQCRLAAAVLAVSVVSAPVIGAGAAGAADRATPADHGTLGEVRARGVLRCGVTRAGVGVSEIDLDGQWQGFFPEFCRAVAAAIFGEPDAVDFVEVDLVVRFEALVAGAYDVLIANSTWTASRDASAGLAFTSPLFYDGQGFLAHGVLGARRVAELGPATVCVLDATTTLQNLRDLVRIRALPLEIRVYRSLKGGYGAFFARACDLFTHDRISLVSERLTRASDPADYTLLEDVISREPLGPVVREGDDAWRDVVQWVTFATIVAEEQGVTRAALAARGDGATADRASADRWRNREVRRLLGLDGEIGAKLGLAADFGRRVIAAVGNYGEIFERTLGRGSKVGLARGLNALWRQGGLIYAPPFL